MRSAISTREFTELLTKLKLPLSSRQQSLDISQSTGQCIAPLLKDARCGVALSGGVDSTALALLMSQCELINQPIVACQIDHSLRVNSHEDVQHCHRWLSQHNIQHCVAKLDWSIKPTMSTLQNSARDRRYQSLETMCRSNNIKYLFLAHTADDRRETFLHRLARGSGLHGLSNVIPAVSTRKDSEVTIVRPLLTVEKPRLIATSNAFGVEWREDPSNQNSQFERVRIRKALKDVRDRTSDDSQPCELESLIDESMSVIESCYNRVKETVDAFIETSCLFEHPPPSKSLQKRLFSLGKVYEQPITSAPCSVNLAALFTFNEELQIIVLSHLLHQVRGDGYSARHWLVTDRIRKLHTHLTNKPAIDKTWLAHGCKLKYISKTRVLRVERATQITAASATDK